jgi:hypothetical protein
MCSKNPAPAVTTGSTVINSHLHHRRDHRLAAAAALPAAVVWHTAVGDNRPSARAPGTSGPRQLPGRLAYMKISARRNRKLDRTHCLADTRGVTPERLTSRTAQTLNNGDLGPDLDTAGEQRSQAGHFFDQARARAAAAPARALACLLTPDQQAGKRHLARMKGRSD